MKTTRKSNQPGTPHAPSEEKPLFYTHEYFEEIVIKLQNANASIVYTPREMETKLSGYMVEALQRNVLPEDVHEALGKFRAHFTKPKLDKLLRRTRSLMKASASFGTDAMGTVSGAD